MDMRRGTFSNEDKFGVIENTIRVYKIRRKISEPVRDSFINTQVFILNPCQVFGFNFKSGFKKYTVKRVGCMLKNEYVQKSYLFRMKLLCLRRSSMIYKLKLFILNKYT